MKKLLFSVLLIGIMGVQAQKKSQQPCERTTEEEDRQGDLKGFIPQYEGWLNGVYIMRQNQTVKTVADFAFLGIRPKINPANKSWHGELGSYYKDYGYHLRNQISFGIKKASGENFSDAEIEKIFRSLQPVRVVGEVKSTGLKVDPKGKPLGPGWTITRCPYVTRDGLGEQMVVYEGPYGIFKLSLVCGNSFEFEEKTPPIKPEPPMPGLVPCPEVPLNVMPTLKPCPDGGQGSVTGTPSGMPTLKNNGIPSGAMPSQVGNSPSGMPTKAPDRGNTQQQIVEPSRNGMVPAQSAGPVKRK